MAPIIHLGKTVNDPIVEEVRRVRDEHTARFNYDLDAIFRDIKEQERLSGRTFVTVMQIPDDAPVPGDLKTSHRPAHA